MFTSSYHDLYYIILEVANKHIAERQEEMALRQV